MVSDGYSPWDFAFGSGFCDLCFVPFCEECLFIGEINWRKLSLWSQCHSIESKWVKVFDLGPLILPALWLPMYPARVEFILAVDFCT
jgi:hypothetical protein